MTRNSMLRKVPVEVKQEFVRPTFPLHSVDWARLVTIDFETYYDSAYTLSKLSTSEYVRDPRFKIQMMGIKIGHGKTRTLPTKQVKAALAAIDWSTHSLLCHNTLFDGFILGDRFDIHPHRLYDTLAMARGLHSNEIGAGLDEVSLFYGGQGKIRDVLETTKGVLNWSPMLFRSVMPYCANDVNETLRIFNKMLPQMPADEIDHIDWITRCFTKPVLRINLPLVQKEYENELHERDELMYAAVDPNQYDVGGELYDYDVLNKALLKTKKERLLEGKERDLLIIKRVLGSNKMFAALLETEGVNPPTKQSAAWLKKASDERDPDKEFIYAFSKTDRSFIDLPVSIKDWGYNMEDPQEVKTFMTLQQRLTDLVDARLIIKSTTNITRAERFLKAGENGKCLPVGYSYYRAHTGRLGGNNKMNMQNLKRGGTLREAILAPEEHVICVVDSGQIEARVNAWLWGQDDLLDDFRKADEWDKSAGVARGDDRDAYCKFGDLIYDREITTEDKTERFVGKVGILGLGYQMGGPKLQLTLAGGALGGAPVFFELERCYRIVSAYRVKNKKIADGWGKCQEIIRDMHLGKTGSWGPINWEANTIWLPNGMALKYPDLQYTFDKHENTQWTYRSGDTRKKIYGGLLCENIVQALARIIVFSQTLEISRTNRVVMSTHDEASALARTEEGPSTLARMISGCASSPRGSIATSYS